MKRIIIALIKAYKKFLSPYITKSCRFNPTCSEYAVEAVEQLGTIRGSLKSFWRILRCNPFSAGGYDPVSRGSKKEK